MIYFTYILCFLNFILVGFGDAAGRNPLIFKKKYLYKVVFHALFVGHILLLITAFCAWLVHYNAVDQSELWQNFIKAGTPTIYTLGGYVAIVCVTFLFYAVPNFEIRSLVTVAVFGPLTMLQPAVIILSGCVFVYNSENWQLSCVWTLGTCSILFFGALLRRLGFAEKQVRTLMRSK